MTANAPPVVAPPIRKPTDLVMLMPQAMQHSLQVMGLKTAKNVQQIYSAQDAMDYLRDAADQMAQRGGA